MLYLLVACTLAPTPSPTPTTATAQPVLVAPPAVEPPAPAPPPKCETKANQRDIPTEWVEAQLAAHEAVGLHGHAVDVSVLDNVGKNFNVLVCSW